MNSVLKPLLYALLALGATTIGSATGIGGGVIIKPVLDAVGLDNAAAINVLSTVTVFSMALVSVIKNALSKSGKLALDLHTMLPLALGSVLGGIFGSFCLSALLVKFSGGEGGTSAQVFIIQNVVLAILILVVFVYMLNKDRAPQLGLHGLLWGALLGFFLGMSAAFLGIGGGPINVAFLVFFFSYDTKRAGLASLLVIVFSQGSKIVSMLARGTLIPTARCLILPLAAMVVAAVLAGFIGSAIRRLFSERRLIVLFNAVQLLVIALCISNVVKYLA
jgi:uncharacterized membrane protein YfcA